VRKQEGISFLLIDMHTPGVTVRPIIMLDEDHEVNEVFFDNVKVPAENLVGQENRAGPMPNTCSATNAPASPRSAAPSASWPS
jgi:alkylation response protein AidB-like acyl-CoA dehydrogenase